MKKIEILIVEDEPKLAQTLTDFLRIQNYEVLHAIAGGKALDIFRENKKKIDLVLLDLMLPDISGYTVRPGFENPGSRFLLKHLHRRKIQYFCSHQ